MTKISNIEKLSPEVAKVLYEADGELRSSVKKDAKHELQKMLSSGQITKDEFNNARKVLHDVSVMKAVAAGNRVDSASEKQTLRNKEAQTIMEQAGLSVEDLYQVAEKFVGDDNRLSYTYLNLSEKKKAKAGEETSSERYNVLNALNDKIKENGGEKELTLKEAKTLMKALGCDIDSTADPGMVVLAALGHPFALGVAIAKPFMKEREFGPQGGEEGGQGSVTNKAEAKMKALKNAAQKSEQTEKDTSMPYNEVGENIFIKDEVGEDQKPPVDEKEPPKIDEE